MYGILTYKTGSLVDVYGANVAKYTIHGSSGYEYYDFLVAKHGDWKSTDLTCGFQWENHL